MPGVHFIEGMNIHPGGLESRIDELGNEKLVLIPQISYEVCHTWLYISVEHLIEADKHRSKRVVAWEGGDEHAKKSTLLREFNSSMQAIVAMAITFESLYSSLLIRNPLDSELLDKWKNGKTGISRYAKVAEVIKRSFPVKNEEMKKLRTNLEELFRFRNMAVHPSSELQDPIIHAELNVGVEPKFARYTAQNAHVLIGIGINTICELGNRKIKNPRIKEYSEKLMEQFQPSIELWKSHYGG